MIGLVNATAEKIPLPDKSVHMVCTSPPYFSLRSYNLPPRIWGGSPTCDHIWGEKLPKAGKISHGQGPSTLTGGHDSWGNRDGASQGQFCQRCGAWRGNLGLEPTPDCLGWATGQPCGACYVCHIVEIFREVRRVLRDDGTAWIVIADSYSSGGGKQVIQTKNASHGLEGMRARTPNIAAKQLLGIPWRCALALQADGWWLRNDIIYSKKNPMPESVTDRCTTSHEYVFLFAKGQWKSRIVKLSNLPSEFVHFSYDTGFQAADSGAGVIGVRLASTILDFAQREHDFSLTPFDSQIGQQRLGDLGGPSVSSLPGVDDAAMLAARLLGAYIPTKVFLEQLKALGITLVDGNHFLIGRRPTIFPLPPGAYGDGKTAIAIHHSGQISKFDFIHGTIITQSPRTCKYYYDQDAIRTPLKESSIERGKYGWDGRGGGAMEVGARSGSGFRRLKETGAKVNELYNPAGSNKRTVWTISTQNYRGNHHAVYPEKLVEPCIKAGSSQRGVCPICAAPWKRVVEITRTKDPNRHTGRAAVGCKDRQDTDQPRMLRNSRVTGWRPTCNCCSENGTTLHPVPATILDPFVGSGTTLVVARALGRSAIGLDLSYNYLSQQVRPRLELDKLAAWKGETPFNPQKRLDDLPLFKTLIQKETQT